MEREKERRLLIGGRRQRRVAYCLAYFLRARLLLISAFIATAAATPVRSQEASPPVGINLTDVQDALVDVFKTSRAFWESDPDNPDGYVWDTGEPLELDENGYPTSIRPGVRARTLLLEALPEYPTGTYTLLYDGEGTIEVGMDAENAVFSDNGGLDNRIAFDVLSTTIDGIMVDITSTDPDDHIRNIRIIRPDEGGTEYLATYESEHFRPLLIERLESYGVIRFMDWMGTNFSPVRTWEDRAKMTQKNWATNFGEGPGMPIELLVELSNATGASPWFCMPHRADDDYVERFAEFVHEHLDPGLDVYVEYSNEVWNGVFSDETWWIPENASGQNSYARDQGTARGWDGDYWEPIGRWVAQRSIEIFDIWAEAFGPDAGRIVRVLPIQNGPGNATPFTLDHVVGGRAAYEQADVVAGAPYFGGEFGPETLGIAGWSAEQLLDSVETQMLAYDGGPYWAEQTIELLANPPYANHDLAYVAYEGGQHLFNYEGSADDDLSQLFVAANRHERMGELYTRYFDWWRDAGGGLFVHYTHTARPGQGSFGLLEHLEQDTLTAPKWLALQAWVRKNRETAVGTSTEAPISEGFTLKQNYPNPFTRSTRIEYELARPGRVRITVFDVLGRKVSTLEDGVQAAGHHRITWADSDLSGGVYFYVIEAEGRRESRKAVVLKNQSAWK